MVLLLKHNTQNSEHYGQNVAHGKAKTKTETKRALQSTNHLLICLIAISEDHGNLDRPVRAHASQFLAIASAKTWRHPQQ